MNVEDNEIDEMADEIENEIFLAFKLFRGDSISPL
jgi:hypothetical protein